MLVDKADLLIVKLVYPLLDIVKVDQEVVSTVPLLISYMIVTLIVGYIAYPQVGIVLLAQVLDIIEYGYGQDQLLMQT